MDNSLQEIAGSFTFLGMNRKILSSLFIALLPAALAVPLAATAATCVGSECELVLDYTGSAVVFSPPEGAQNLRFEIYGASGGRGAAGGKVTGTLTQIPESITILVGGVGRMGAGAQGGFNGGGGSGGNSGTEGSGGGATDLRLGAGLDTRIAVAGGGGGGGGEAGGSGGQGGDTFGGQGVSGQGSGGGGGTPDRGGTAGASNGGFSGATAGSFGNGGRGGYSSFAGGGGGGGGWYGGGGGGSDDNTCCSDGGGGGGGSSYTSIQHVSSVSHQAGANWGDGRVILRYTALPTITQFELQQLDGQTASFQLTGSVDLVGLTAADFSLLGTGCELGDITITGTSATGEILGCESGEISLTLAALAFGEGSQGPAQAETVSLNFDATGPTFTFDSEPEKTSASAVSIPYSVSDELVLVADNFVFSGCQELTITASELLLTGCQTGTVELTLVALSLGDQWQNLAPQESISHVFEVDQIAPIASWTAILVSGDGPFRYSSNLQFSEAVTIDTEGLVFNSDVDCETGFEVVEDALQVWAECGHGSLGWSFTPGAADLVGNLMPTNPLEISIANLFIEPEPVTEPEPAPSAEAPAQPAPPSNPVLPEPVVSEPVVSEPVVSQPVVSEPVIVVEPVPTPSPEAVVEPPTPIQPEPVAEAVVVGSEEVTEMLFESEGPMQSQEEQLSLETDPLVEPEQAQETLVVSDAATDELSQTVASPALFEPEQQGQLPLLVLMVIGVAALLGFGAWRLSGR